MTDTNESNAAAVIAEAHRNKTGVMIPKQDGGAVVLLDKGKDGFTTHDLPALNPVLPDHIQAKARLIEQGSFEAFVTRYKTDQTIIMADPDTASMSARFDYHHAAAGEPAKPGRNLHSATFDCGFSEDWKRWRGANGKLMGQEDFAYFIEEMLHTIAVPDGADLLEMAQTLKINRGVVFKSNTRLRDGTVDIAYEEKDDASTKAGKVTVPEALTLVVPIYMNRAAIKVPVKLRYRVEKGEPLRFRLDILNIKTIELHEFQAMAGEISEATGVPAFFGVAN